MKKVVRIGALEDQDDFRRNDIRNISPNDRVKMLIELQARLLRWDLNPKIERVGKLKRFNFRDVS